MAEDRNWFLRERSEAWASLLLTFRDGMKVRRESESEKGVDLFVELAERGKPISTRIMLAHVRGTLTANRAQWPNEVKDLFQAGPHYLPACVIVVEVRENAAEYAWLAEPKIEGQTARLDSQQIAEFRPFDQAAVGHIVERVKAWYAMLPRPSVSQAS